MLQPRDAHRLLGDSLFEIDFEQDPMRFSVAGVGLASLSCVSREACYRFRTTRGRHVTILLPILIARPVPGSPSQEGNWGRISTLGRDVLHRLSLRLDYRAEPAVVLSA